MVNNNLIDHLKEKWRSNRYLVILVLISLVISSMIFVNLYHYPIYGTDDGFQVRAVTYMQTSRGYSIASFPEDLSQQPMLRHMNEWPPCYTFSLYLLEKLGLSLFSAILLFKFMTITIGCVGWLILCHPYSKNLVVSICFALILPFTLNLNPTDLFVTCLTPYLMMALLNLYNKDRKNPYSMPILVSLLLSTLIIFKFTAITLLASSAIFMLLLSKPVTLPKIGRAVSILILPSILLITIFVWNKLLSGNTSFMTAQYSITPQFPDIKIFLQALIQSIVGLGLVVGHIARALPNVSAPQLSTGIFLITLLFFSGALHLRLINPTMFKQQQPLIYYLGITLVSTVGALFAIDYITGFQHNAAAIQRYSNHTAPLLNFLILLLVGHIIAKIKRKIWVIAVSCLLLCVSGYPSVTYLQHKVPWGRSNIAGDSKVIQQRLTSLHEVSSVDKVVVAGLTSNIRLQEIPNSIMGENGDIGSVQQFFEKALTSERILLVLLLDRYRDTRFKPNEGQEYYSRYGINSEAIGSTLLFWKVIPSQP